ncbi:hypothetical protein GQ53DRAFT_820361 [Thozetella sp. PMI_491]|nr:hypothetical protein GQ53DRAFT_820361 [Thozetella sp. PMI_491]
MVAALPQVPQSETAKQKSSGSGRLQCSPTLESKQSYRHVPLGGSGASTVPRWRRGYTVDGVITVFWLSLSLFVVGQILWHRDVKKKTCLKQDSSSDFEFKDEKTKYVEVAKKLAEAYLAIETREMGAADPTAEVSKPEESK